MKSNSVFHLQGGLLKGNHYKLLLFPSYYVCTGIYGLLKCCKHKIILLFLSFFYLFCILEPFLYWHI